jgi:hypothetical protein
MSPGPLQYVATPVSLLNQSGHETPLNSTSTQPKVKNIQLFQEAPSSIYNSKVYYSVEELAADQCAQVQNCTATPIRCTVDRLWGSSRESSLSAGPLLISACQLTGRAFVH